MKNNNPSYYAIIPASVRYDKALIEGAKLMYGEITALSNSRGYCNATNGYFSELYGRTKQCISKWIKSLESRGYVTIEYFDVEPGKTERNIRLTEAANLSTVVDPHQPELTPLSTVVDQNNTSINNNIDQNEDFDPVVNPDWEIRFDEFWNDFDNKKGKKKAKTAFKNLTKTKQISCSNKETIAIYKEYLAKTGISQMHPTSWINGERWEDDFTVKSKNTTNTDEALNDTLLPADQNERYQQYVTGIIEHFPNLWKSECRILSKSEWQALNYNDEAIFKNIRVSFTRTRAAKVRKEIHELFERNHFERKKYTRIYDAIISDYRNYMNREKTLVA